MSDNTAAWGVKDEGNMWWAQGNTDQQQQYIQQLQQQQIDVATSQHQQQQQQMFNYKMASTFQNQNSNVDNTSPVGAQGMRGYDYGGMTGGNPQMNTPAQGNQWWYPPSTMDDMHNTMQDNMQQHGMQQQNNMTPAHSPSPLTSQSDSQSLQEQEANRQHQEAIQQHHQAIAEAQARHQQLQQQTQQLQHQLQQQQLLNNHQQILQQQRPVQKGRMPRGSKGGDAKPRGRMTAYAFFVQTCREEHKKKHPEENVVFAEFSKKCAERWKTMSDKEKKRFHEMAETDKKRYDTEMQGYTPAKGEKQVRGKKRKQTKDPHAPKRSLSAFFHFSNDERQKVKSANPDWGVGDVAKELGRRWADTDPESRAKFEAMADKDKARYEREMTAYKKKNEAAAQQQVPEEEVEDEEEEEEDDD